jgi:fumarylacetoacetase
MTNETHDPALRSWVDSANDPSTDFPVQNLPFAVFRRKGHTEQFRVGVGIGDQVVDLAAAHAAGVFSTDAAAAAACADEPSLNALMARGPRAWSALRIALSRLLREGAARTDRVAACLVPIADIEFNLPARIGDYTDMYTSIHHASNVGRLFRPDNPLMPNFKWLPVGYHGRASSVVLSGHPVVRPWGQIMPPGAQSPVFSPSKRLDYELELAIWIGTSNALSEPVAIDKAESHVFGIGLLNDWSARDIQSWEYQPLGPFLSKNFATTVSPWVVTLEALAPYRCAWTRSADDPQPLAYLESSLNRQQGAFDISIEAWLQTDSSQGQGTSATRLSQTSFRHAYWSIAQMIAHHTVGGCNLQTGDLIGSGTQSGPEAHEAGALIELTQGGRKPLTLGDGQTRTFLEDGDTVIFRAWCEAANRPRIGFGECRGKVLSARPVV